MGWVPSYEWIVLSSAVTSDAGDAFLNVGILNPKGLFAAQISIGGMSRLLEFLKMTWFFESDLFKAGY